MYSVLFIYYIFVLLLLLQIYTTLMILYTYTPLEKHATTISYTVRMDEVLLPGVP